MNMDLRQIMAADMQRQALVNQITAHVGGTIYSNLVSHLLMNKGDVTSFELRAAANAAVESSQFFLERLGLVQINEPRETDPGVPGNDPTPDQAVQPSIVVP